MIDIEKFICSLIHRSSGFCVIKVVDIIDALHHQGLDYKDGKIIRITPEFKQSEDESIRKIISDILLIDSDEIREILDANNVLMQDVYAWLEKQDTNISSFPKEQQVFMKKYVSLDKITLIKLLAERDANNAEIIESFEKQDKQKPADKVEPKFHEGDVMRTLQEATDNITDGLPVVVSIDNEYYHCNNELIAIKDQDNYEYPPINKKHNALSEDDERNISKIIEILHYTEKTSSIEPISLYSKEINWLKSLKDRYFWKPTDAQIASLTIACDRNDRIGFDLTQLLRDLKKLKGE